MEKAGEKVQGVAAAAIVAVGALLKAGVISAAIANPITATATFLSAFLPSLFGRKKPKASTLLAAPVTRGRVVLTLAAVVGQVVALLTVLGVMLHQVPGFLVPDAAEPWLGLVAGLVAALLPGLQKVVGLLRDFGGEGGGDEHY